MVGAATYHPNSIRTKTITISSRCGVRFNATKTDPTDFYVIANLFFLGTVNVADNLTHAKDKRTTVFQNVPNTDPSISYS